MLCWEKTKEGGKQGNMKVKYCNKWEWVGGGWNERHNFTSSSQSIFLPWHYVYVVIIGTPQLKSARVNCQWNHLSHLIQVPSGPNFHRWITPLKGVCHPVSCQQWPHPIMILSWQSSRLHTQYRHGPLYTGIFNSEVPCIYYRIIWRKKLEFHCIIYAV